MKMTFLDFLFVHVNNACFSSIINCVYDMGIKYRGNYALGSLFVDNGLKVFITWIIDK